MNPSRTPASRRAWYAKNKKRIRATIRKRYANDPGFRQSCLEHHRQVRARFRMWLNGQKKDRCVDCRKKYPPIVMDFDHVRGRKFFTIGDAAIQRTIGRERILREIAKCDLVCSNCHRLRTGRRRKK